MKVTEQDVKYVASLAQLQLTEDEQRRMLRDLNSILEYVDRLKQLDTSNVPPMAQVSDRVTAHGRDSRSEIGREDVLFGLRKSLPHEEALANAPESDGSFFIVPKVIER
jgi:aspartyl-tRNA(Asn)/glutamyl-tRNA(Gln) amidotransferase subunit C